MDWQSLLSDAAIVASVGSAIFAIINVVKRIWTRLPWSWAKNTPGEVWWVLSVLMAVGVAFGVYWDNFFGPGASFQDGITTMAYSLLGGAGSNLLSNVTSTAGAKLKASKEEARARISQTGNLATQSGNDAEYVAETPTKPAVIANDNNLEQEPSLLKDAALNDNKPADSASRLADESTATLYQQVRLTPAAPYVMLSDDGKLYRVSNGRVQHLAKGWNG